jgi:hypothetical protein
VISKNKSSESYFQKRFPLVGIISVMLFMSIFQSVLPLSYESTSSIDSAMTSNQVRGSSMSLKVSVISPQDGTVLTNFPANLEIKVTCGTFPVQGARVQFWMMGGSHDAEMHNAFLTMTDSLGSARLTLSNQNTLDQGLYIWYADAIKPGLRGGSSEVISFINSFGNTNKIVTSGGTVSTNQNEYSLSSDKGTSVVIHGNVNNYHLGEPIILKIKLPSGKIIQMVEYGTYLGAFQSTYKLGPNAELGLYSLTVSHNYFVYSTSEFHVRK